jgi:MFS family permease
MSVAAMQEIVDPHPFTAPLLPIMGVVFVGFLVVGVAMPVLPLYVHDGLGFGPFVVGLVAGSQFAASLISRPWAGNYSDGCGAKRAVVLGLLAASASGLLYLCSLLIGHEPEASVAVLLLGRAILGGAESFIITAAVSWGLAIVDRRNTGKVIAWIGSAMFGAFAIGAPVGSAIYAKYGFVGIALVTALAPLATLPLIAPLPVVVPVPRARISLVKVFGQVWVPGFGSALGSVGFGAVTTFAALLFADRGWTQGWLAYTAYALAFILARVFFGHAADRFGGAKVALFCVLIETAGQALSGWPFVPNWRCSGPLSQDSDFRWSIPASASKRSGGCRHTAAALRWEPIPLSSTWLRGSQVRRLGWSRKRPA